MEELLELEPLPATALTGVAVARDRQGLYVAKAPRSLRVRPGDRLLSARVVFEGAPPEEVARLLEGARSCRVGLQLRRPPGPPGSPGGRGHPGAADGLSPTPPKKPPPAPGAASAAAASAVAVEFALPKLPRLGKSRSVAEPAATAPEPPPAEPKRPRATPSRLTVKEAAASKTPAMEEPAAKPAAPTAAAAVPAGPGARFPAVEVAVPKVAAGLSLTGATPPAPAPAKEPVLRLPRLEVAVPALPLPVALPESGAAAPPPPRKGAVSPVPKAAAPVAGQEGDAGARGGFAAIHVPSIGISVPSAVVELLPERGGGAKPEPPVAPGLLPRLEVKLPAQRSESPPAASAQVAFPVPAVELAVPRVGPAPAEAAAAAATVPETAARFAKGLRKLSLELEPAAALPAVEIAAPARAPAAKPPRFALPRVALALGKLKPGGNGAEAPPAARDAAGPGPVAALDLAGASGVKLKVPKVSLAPFGAEDGDGGAGGQEGARGAAAKLPWLGTGGAQGDAGGAAEPGSPRLRVPRVGIALPVPGSRRSPSLPRLPAGPEAGGVLRLPRFGGSSPDLRPGGDAGAVRRGGSAESLTVGAAARRMPEPLGVAWWKPKTGWAVGDGGVQPATARFTFPAVGFSVSVTALEGWKLPRAAGAGSLKVPALELAPPGREEPPVTREAARGGPGWAGGALEAEGRMMRMAGVRKAVSALVRPKEKRDGDAAGAGGARPHLNGEPEGRGRRRRRWVPTVGFTPGGSPEAGGGHGDSQLRRRPPVTGGGPGGTGTPWFQLPKLELSPQPCGEW